MPTRPEEHGAILRSLRGHSTMSHFEIKPVPESNSGSSSGYWVWVACDFARPDLPDWQPDAETPQGHWLALASGAEDGGASSSIVEQPRPYVWPTLMAAIAAKDRWERQDRQSERSGHGR